MANLKEIRERIQSVISTQQMTRAMKMVAAAKLRRAQEAIWDLRPYATKLQEIMGDIAANVNEEIDSPYAKVRPVEKVLMVVITSNRGLCGAFNTNVCKGAVSAIKSDYAEQHAAGNLEMLCIGKKAFDFFSNRDYQLIGKNHDVYADLSFETVNEVATMILNGFEQGRWDKVDLVYNEFRNVMSQITQVDNFLPVQPPTAEDQQDDAHEEESGHAADYIFEPGQEEILADLVPKSLRLHLFRSILESNAGEQGARMVAMDNATENAEELLKSLRLDYNQARQAAITTEILEIVAGANALGSA